MDWDTIFKDNSQSLFTLAGVFLGSLITFLINFLNLRYQSIERDKDREEKRKDEQTQLSLELTRTDIKALESTIDSYLKGIAEMRRIRVQIPDKEKTRAKMEAEFRLRIGKEDSFYELIHVNLIADKLAYTLGEPFYSEYRNYIGLIKKSLDALLSPPYKYEKERELDLKIVALAGKLHTMLQEKLISIRNT